MDTIATVSKYILQYTAPSLDDLTDEHSAVAPTPESKTPGWILGHLAVSGDYVRRKCGRPPITPKEWGPRFAPGSTPSTNPADYPPMGELRDAFRAVYRDLAEIAPTFSPEQLASPNPLGIMQDRLGTFGEFVSHIMTSHLAYHLGQLSGWRGAVGLAARPGATSPV